MMRAGRAAGGVAMAGTGDRLPGAVRVLIAVPTLALGLFALVMEACVLLICEFGLAWTSFGTGFLTTYPF